MVCAVAMCVAMSFVATSCSVDGQAQPMAGISAAGGGQSAENGLDELDPAEALSTVIEALMDEETFHVSGSMVKGGNIDISYQVGVGAIGTLSDADEESGPVQIVAAEGRIYVTGDEEFLAASVDEEAAETIAGKWVLLGEESTSRFEVIADGGRFVDAVLGSGAAQVDLTGVRDVGGVPAVGLVFRDTGATLWVAATGAPLPIQLEEKGASGGSGVLKFDRIGEVLELEIPDEDSVVNAGDVDE